MRHYVSPTGRFGLDYPKGWQIRERSDSLVFFKDDPDEGTAFVLVPYQAIPGAVAPDALLGRIVQGMRGDYPDLQVRSGQIVQQRSTGGTIVKLLNADARWTGRHGQAMLGTVLLVTYGSPGAASTTFVFMGAQAPAVAYPSMRPVFIRMIQSFFAGR